MILKGIYAVIVSFVITLIATKLLIPFLKKHQFKQFVRDVGPESHKKKTGTPSMGGLAMILGITISSLVITIVTKTFSLKVVIAIVMMLLYGLIGFIDDYKKAIEKKNDGLSAKAKLLLQVIFSIVLGVESFMQESGGNIYIPFAHVYLNLRFFYIIWVIFVMTAFTNSVNLTDGLDGLASGVTAIVAIVMMFVTTMLSGYQDVIMYGAVVGACIGFLMFNKYPAKIFMGDTGSMALGGFIATIAILNKIEIVLAIAGLVYVIEAISVIMQVGYFKLTHGKRIFRMAPIHHHFELGGMEEKDVAHMFWGFSILFAFIAYISI